MSSVELISYIQPVNKPVDWTLDKEIVRAAKVSYANDHTVQTEEKDNKLIKYLMVNKHTSPFEAAVFTFHVQCPIFIARQFMRHRTFSYNEVSARYTQLPDEFFVPDRLLKQATGNKQMSSDEPINSENFYLSMMEEHCKSSYEIYESLISAGVSREYARTVLPVSIMTRFYCTVDLHNLFHFLRLRLHAHAQKEIREVAEQMLALIEPLAPLSVAAFKDTLA